jgi:hypothetical protein
MQLSQRKSATFCCGRRRYQVSLLLVLWSEPSDIVIRKRSRDGSGSLRAEAAGWRASAYLLD